MSPFKSKEEEVMSERKYSLEQDLREASAMAEGLDRYIQGDQLYGTAGSGGFLSSGNLPSLTIGALVMRIRRLKAQNDKMTNAQREQLRQIETKHQAVLKEWRYRYQDRMVWEANSRLDAMAVFFEECSSNPRICSQVYMPEVLRRTTVQELMQPMKDLNVAELPEVEKKARMMDSKLRRFVRAAPFVWSQELAPYYPPEEYWWMYNAPQEI
jgi:hypothetical protein